MSVGQTVVDMMMAKTKNARYHRVRFHCKAIGVGSRPLLQPHLKSLTGAGLGKGGSESCGARTLLSDVLAFHIYKKKVPGPKGKLGVCAIGMFLVQGV